VWSTLAELSYFYRQLCAKEIMKGMMEKLEKEVPVLLCKLEKIFPPGFFNPMQHLLIHLPYEAKVGGLCNIGGCIILKGPWNILEQWLETRQELKDASPKLFCLKRYHTSSSVYFAEEHNVNAPTMRYNIDEEPPVSDIKKFQWRGTTVSSSMTYYPSQEERTDALLYMFSNMEEMDPYFM